MKVAVNKRTQKTAECKICENFRSPKFVSNFRPYLDVDWSFPIYECDQCGARFALRDPSINYHEILHKKTGGGYEYQYKIAKHVKEYLARGALAECEQYLTKAGYKYAELIRFIKSKNKKARILEVGCSSGFMTAFLRSIGYDIEGVDVSKTAIEYAQKTFGPYYSLQPKNKQYDLIIHLGLIGCVNDPKKFILHYLDLLKTNGIMFFNSPNVESPRQLGELWASTPPPDLIYLFSEKSFKYIVNDSFDVSYIKLSTKDEVVAKNIRKILNRQFNDYPRIFRAQFYNDRSIVKKIFSKIAILNANIAYPLLKKYDNEFGLFIMIRKKCQN